MSDRNVDSLAKEMKWMSFAKDQVIFAEGDKADRAYVIAKGSVLITKQSNGKAMVLTKMVKNQIFGEMALVNGTARSASAIAAEPTDLLIITAEQFKAKMGNLDIFMKFLVNHLMARIFDLSVKVIE